jgi:hypothetical protein
MVLDASMARRWSYDALVMIITEYGLLPTERVSFSYGTVIRAQGDNFIINARGGRHRTSDGSAMRLLTSMVLRHEEISDPRDHYSHMSAVEKVLRALFEDVTSDPNHKALYSQWFRLAERYYAVKCRFETTPPDTYWPRDGSAGSSSSPAW